MASVAATKSGVHAGHSQERGYLSRWEEKTLLVLGTTYPNYSMKYLEVACTGAIDEETGRMVRIHPMPKRYLEDGQRFKNFQRIRARIQPNFADGRGESMRIDPDSIEPLDVIPPEDHDRRRVYIDRSPNLVGSVEELQARQRADGMSLGAIVPKEIIGVYLQPRKAASVAEWKRKEADLMAQQTMNFLRPPKKLDCPEVEFHVQWRCDDRRCERIHDMTLKTWGLHEQYRRSVGDPKRDEKVLATMQRGFDLSKRDVFLFLGTFVSRKFEFGLMDAYTPPRRCQLSLY